MKNIILVGFMGTGKSVVGKRLAKQLNMKFVSTDDIIEDREKRPISEIFAKSGEPYFRKIEKEVVKEAADSENVVIAAGGGAVLDEDNITNLKKKGVIVCLNATPEAVYERTKKYKHRPLLNVDDPISKIKELMDKRAPYYAKADHQIDTAGKTVEEVTAEIIKVYQRTPSPRRGEGRGEGKSE
ncbi:shikimate kinase [Candidatus Micrarchaeota archaeon CG08_land_8_20_14_0_20_59_11]|nr:MAG: shikimate kinase [Candidatus Micrarchaeota archaeon CG08_land_8_20_14_0_20_59_11]